MSNLISKNNQLVFSLRYNVEVQIKFVPSDNKVSISNVTFIDICNDYKLILNFTIFET